MIKHHPSSRLERLQLKEKYSFKKSRLKGSSDEYLGTTDAKSEVSTLEEGSREETDQPRAD